MSTTLLSWLHYTIVFSTFFNHEGFESWVVAYHLTLNSMSFDPWTLFLLANDDIFVESMGLSCATEVHQVVKTRRSLGKYLRSIFIFSEKLNNLCLSLVFLFIIFDLFFFFLFFILFLLLFLFRQLVFGTKNPYFPIETEQQSMSKISHFISMKNNLSSFFVGKRNITRSPIFINWNSRHNFFTFIPHKNARFFDSFQSFSKIMSIWLLTFSLVEVTFDFFLFNLCNIDPPRSIRTNICATKYIILEHFLMFSLGRDRVESTNLLYSSLLAVVT